MEAIEYAARAIARDIYTMLKDTRVLAEPFTESLIDEIVSISRAHIQIFTQTLPRSDDVYQDLPYSLFNDQPTQVTKPPDADRTLRALLLDSFTQPAVDGRSAAVEPAKAHSVTRTSALTSADELSKLIEDLTATVQPRSASLTLPVDWKAHPEATIAGGSSEPPLCDSLTDLQRVRCATYAVGRTIVPNSFGRSATLGSASTAFSSNSLQPGGAATRSPHGQLTVKAIQTCDEYLTPMQEDGEAASLEDHVDTPTTGDSEAKASVNENRSAPTRRRAPGGGRRDRRKGETAATAAWDDDYNRMVFVSWIPRQLRSQAGEKRKAELNLKKLLRTELCVEGLAKVLLFPPKGTHCKLVFKNSESAALFVERFGGLFGSVPSERWKHEICQACKLDINDIAFNGTTVTVEWAQPHFS